jgi:septal ring factor EnvC (AmiA/AmiB activator)
VNLEKAVQFILDQQARTEANLAVVYENQAKTEAALAKLSDAHKDLAKQLAKTDRKVAATAVLVTAGMKRLIRIEKTFNQKFDRLFGLLTQQRSNGRRHYAAAF